MEERVRPARPHHKLTDDGRRMREVLTYSRRGSRFTPRQAEAWEAYAARWWVPDEAVDAPDFSLPGLFGREAPLIVEIGSGIGESTVALAAARPDHDVVAFEVWRPGVADTLGRIGEAGLGNVRLLSVDAVWSVEHLIEPDSLAGLWIFFPDPWHKKRHHKRRLVDDSFMPLAHRVLRPGGVLRLATDWAEYAEQMAEVVARAEGFEEAGRTERFAGRTVTRFETKGTTVGREIWDLTATRR